MPQERKTIAYARVSGHDQKGDLERQKQALELYCAKQGWTLLYDSWSRKNQKLLDGVKRAVEAASC